MKILIIDKVHPILAEKFTKQGWECDSRPLISPQEVYEIIQNYEGLIIRSKLKVTKELIDQAHKLKFIGRVGSGLENIDIKYARQKGIVCLNSPEGNRVAVGEHAVGMLLCLVNKIHLANAEVKSGKWLRDANWGIEIENKNIGIIGYGNMGSSLAQRLSGFGCNILAYDKYKTGFGNTIVKETTLDELFVRADILSLHVPLTEETRHMVNLDFIRNFKKKILLINTSRGEVVNTPDLTTALQQGKIKGAALDVLEYEKHTFETLHPKEMPAAMQYLINSPNVLLTPHIAGWTYEAYYKLSDYMATKILDHFNEKKDD